MAAPPEPVQVARAPKRRDRDMRSPWDSCLSLWRFVAGMGIENSRNAAPGTWSGSLLVGGSTIAWGPRVSPDGRTVAFIVMVDDQTQVALMDASPEVGTC